MINITNEYIWDKLKDIEDKLEYFFPIIERFENLDNRIKECLDDLNFEAKIEILDTYMRDIIDQTKANILRVNSMTTELKGVISMSRAALKSSKKDE